MRLYIWPFLCLLPAILPAQSPLSLSRIMQGEDFVGYAPRNFRWSDDSETLYFRWNPERDTLPGWYQVGWESREPEKVEPEALRQLPAAGIFTEDRRLKAFERNGDLFLWESGRGERQLTFTVERESPVALLSDGKELVFEKDDNLFLLERESGVLHQLTDFREGAEPSERAPEAFRQWLAEDQEMFEVLMDRRLERETGERRREALRPERPRRIYIGRQRLTNLRISPDGRFVTYSLVKSPEPRPTSVPDFVTESGYTEERRARSKVGSPQRTFTFHIYDRKQDTVLQVDPAQLPDIKRKPAFLEEYHSDTSAWQPEYDKAREVSFFGPYYSPGGKAALVARSLDNKDRWILLLEPENGSLKILDHQHDEAWIGGPGISSWNFSGGNIGWLKDVDVLWYQTEATGYSHLVLQDVEKGEERVMTFGDFEILDVELSHDGNTFYITSNAESPHEHHFYHLSIADGKMTRITERTGGHQVTLSPDQQRLAIRFSTSNSPWELYLMENRPGAEMEKITTSTTEEFRAYNWRQPEIIRFEAEDGVMVPARLYRPEDAQAGGPAVIFVHGAGYLQNVHEWWSSYYREYMFHNMLVDQGYTVLDIDYRGSAGYGRDWRTAIYRHMGGKDLSDQVDGAKYLVEELGIDPDRIGIYGGSYGGFITLMALFTSPGTFEAGAALRSVTDWAHYNHGYTSNILNTPVEDPKAYRRSSPIYFADQLEDHLLILHGMVDTNVQFQDVVRLAQRLIELGKEDWEFAVFPVEGHGFQESSSWADEYRRIFELFEEELKK